MIRPGELLLAVGVVAFFRQNETPAQGGYFRYI